MDDDNVKKKAKGIKRRLMFENYKDSLFNDKAILRSQQIFKSNHHNVYTEEVKYQHLINKRERVGIDHFNNPKAFIEYSDDMCSVYKNIDDYNSDKENEILNISLVFITQSYFKVQKDVRLNTTHFLSQKFQVKENFNKLR